MNPIRLTRVIRAFRTIPLVTAAALFAMPAHATLVDIDKSGYHDSVFVLGSDLHLTDFHSSTAGKVTIQLADIAWTDVLQSLSTSLSRLGKTVLTEKGSGGRLSFDIQKDEVLSLGIYALAGGSRKYGLYTLDCSFTANATSQVPVPAAGLLLASGLGLLPTLRRRRAVRVAHAI
jgi:hypothetical protein